MLWFYYFMGFTIYGKLFYVIIVLLRLFCFLGEGPVALFSSQSCLGPVALPASKVPGFVETSVSGFCFLDAFILLRLLVAFQCV